MSHRRLIALAGLTLCAAVASAQQPTDTALPRRPQLGVSLVELPDSLRARGLTGAVVQTVIPGTAAEQSRLRTGDVITAVTPDGASASPIPDVARALVALRRVTPGTRASLSVVRGGATQRLAFVGREWPREHSEEFDVVYTAVMTPSGRRRVIVTHPRDAARHPAVLIIGGIGCYTIDAATGPNAYRDLAYHLTRRGYATVRVEKSGVGDSEGAPCLTVDFEAELSGYAAALAAMRTYAWVDPTRVALFGHSIGGIAGPLLVGRDTSATPVRALAVLSTVGIAWYEYELPNLRRQLRLEHAPPDSIEAIMRRKTTCTYHFLIDREPRESAVRRDSSCARVLPYPASDAYMWQVAAVDQAALWKPVAVPTLVMWGASDFITDRDEHLALVERVNAFHPGAATFADVAETDHFISRQASQDASMRDVVPGLDRPYYGGALEPILDAWLDRALSVPAPTRPR